MCPRYLGVKAVLVKSFARIHETNLKKQGILALTFADPADWAQVDATDRISITGLSGFAPGQGLTVTLKKADGRTVTITANHTFTDKQIQWFKAGSALNALGE
jgi:aconitate hydratase